MKQSIRFKLNKEPITIQVNGEESLLTVIRTYLDKTGTKYGCGVGNCGACTVLINKEPVQACMTFVEDIEGAEIITIEGLGINASLHPIQKAFVEHDALQCGFCTPGMIMKAYGLLLNNPKPTRKNISTSMDENLCRCGSYTRIVDAIQTAAIKMKEKT